jgi:hypothetical protein
MCLTVTRSLELLGDVSRDLTAFGKNRAEQHLLECQSLLHCLIRLGGCRVYTKHSRSTRRGAESDP